MEIRMNKPKGLGGPKVFLLVHGGYDFDPTILAVCTSEERANEMLKEHYSNPENSDYPWNRVYQITATLDDWIDYKGVDKAHGDLVGLAAQAGLVKE